MCFKKTLIFFILLVLMKHNFVMAKTVDLHSIKYTSKVMSPSKNQIIGAFGARKVCMNVCNPPYYSQEYPPTYGSQSRPAWNQNDMPGGEGYDNPADYGQNSLPNFENLEENQFQLQGDFGDYISSCYRNMFKRKYRLDPGFLKPLIYNYHQSILKKNNGSGRNRSYYQDSMNCQLICYPIMVPSYEPHSTTTTEKTASESSGTTEETIRKTRKPTAKHGKKNRRHK